MDAQFDLDRFLDAQRPIYAQALAELDAGRKESHWMWFIFPQLKGLGRSATATHYGIVSAAEARAYLGHEILGLRLLECTRAVLTHRDQRAETIFGSVDAMKFRSSMTLFDAVAGTGPFGDALAHFYAGARDEATLRLLGIEEP